MSSYFVKPYAKALFQHLKQSQDINAAYDSYSMQNIISLKQKEALSDIIIAGEELTFIRAVIICSKKLSLIFKSPIYPESQKLDILLSLFPGLTVPIKSFLKVLSEKSHLFLLPQISNEFGNILLKVKNTTKVNIILGTEVEENTGNNLLRGLKNITASRDIILGVSYRTGLVGGIIIEYNSVAIDASVLAELRLIFSD